jgi:hypothetical protein
MENKIKEGRERMTRKEEMRRKAEVEEERMTTWKKEDGDGRKNEGEAM